MKKITTVFMLLFAAVCFAQFPYLQGKLLIGQELQFYSAEKLKEKTDLDNFTGTYSDPNCYHIYEKINSYYTKVEALAGKKFIVKDVIIKKDIALNIENILVLNSGDVTIYYKVRYRDKLLFDLPNFKITDPTYWDGYITESISDVLNDKIFTAKWALNFQLHKKIVQATKEHQYTIDLYTREPFIEGNKFKLVLEDGTVIPLIGLVSEFIDGCARISSSFLDKKYIVQMSKSPIKFIDYGDMQSPYERGEEVKNVMDRLLLKS